LIDDFFLKLFPALRYIFFWQKEPEKGCRFYQG
jgi:hypothetical protein